MRDALPFIFALLLAACRPAPVVPEPDPKAERAAALAAQWTVLSAALETRDHPTGQHFLDLCELVAAQWEPARSALGRAYGEHGDLHCNIASRDLPALLVELPAPCPTADSNRCATIDLQAAETHHRMLRDHLRTLSDVGAQVDDRAYAWWEREIWPSDGSGHVRIAAHEQAVVRRLNHIATIHQMPPTGCQRETFSVAIGIGHAATRPTGARSARGRTEFSFNRELSELVLLELKARNAKQAFIINPNGRKLRLSKRADIAASRGADVFLAIHHDSVQPHYLEPWRFNGADLAYCDRFRGFSLLTSKRYGQPTQSLALAKAIGGELVRGGWTPATYHTEPIPGENRPLIDPKLGMYVYDHLGILRALTIPGLVLEAGVIVHRDEEFELSDPLLQHRMAMHLAAGLVTYCDRNSGPP